MKVFSTQLVLHTKVRKSLVGSPTRSSTLLFDMGFRFCLTGDVSSSEDVGPRAFEKRFGAEAQHYAAFHPSTIRVLTFERSEEVTTERPKRVSTTAVLRPSQV